VRRIQLVGLRAIVIAFSSCGSDDDATSASNSAAVSPSTAATLASTTTEPPGREVIATAAAGATTAGEPICDAEQHCIYPLTITATISGDLTGSTIAHSAGALAGTDFAASDTQIFTGSVAGCGTGTLVFLSLGRGSTTGPTTGTWTIAEGFGTGDLADAVGSGTTTTGPGSDGTLSSKFSGRITCE
jgi:hypothetical protein